jgi:hypothetical protein
MDFEKLENLLLMLTPPMRYLCSGYRMVQCTIPFQSKNKGIGFNWYSAVINALPISMDSLRVL